MRRALRLIGGLLASLAFLVAWAFLIEPDQLVVSTPRLALPRWPADYPALRVAIIGDLHAGAPFITTDKIDRIVAATNAAGPDLVVLLGDYVIQHVPGGTPMPIEPVAERLGRLRAPLGTLAVLGNHDWWDDGPRITRAFEAAGITVLENRAVERRIGGRPVWIAGVGDATTWHADPTRALREAGQPVVVITHNPAPFAAMPAGPVVMLASHTHGGQVRLPWIGSLISPRGVPRRWSYGHVAEDGRDLFVNTGLGTSILPVRFGTPPVVDVITLTSTTASGAQRAQ